MRIRVHLRCASQPPGMWIQAQRNMYLLSAILCYSLLILHLILTTTTDTITISITILIHIISRLVLLLLLPVLPLLLLLPLWLLLLLYCLLSAPYSLFFTLYSILLYSISPCSILLYSSLLYSPHPSVLICALSLSLCSQTLGDTAKKRLFVDRTNHCRALRWF